MKMFLLTITLAFVSMVISFYTLYGLIYKDDANNNLGVGEIGQIIRSSWVLNNGILTYFYKIPLGSSTSTICSIRSPAATSTIVHASVALASTTPVARIVEIGKSAQAGSTTTLLARLSLAANTQGILVATSTLNDSDNLVIAPSNYVVVNFGAAASGTPAGNCEAIFRVTN